MGDETRRYMVFERGGRSYAVPANRVAEVAVNLHVTPVPLTGPAVSGLVPLHGHPVAIVDLEAWFSSTPRTVATDEIVAQMVVLHIDIPGSSAAVRFAVVADRVLGYRSIPIEAPVSDDTQPPFVIATGRAGTTAELRSVIQIDPNRLFDATLASMPEPLIASTGP